MDAVEPTVDEIIRLVGALPGVVVLTAGEENGSPPLAWGDTFFFYDPDDLARDRRLPFATIVTHDYPGFDTFSDLDRDGVFRVNVAVGRDRFVELLGHSPSGDPRASDVLMAHPVYAQQSWVSVVSPIASTAELVRDLLAHAHHRAVRRHRPR